MARGTKAERGIIRPGNTGKSHGGLLWHSKMSRKCSLDVIFPFHVLVYDVLEGGHGLGLCFGLLYYLVLHVIRLICHLLKYRIERVVF